MIKYLSIKEVSFILGVCTETLRRWDNSGKFKCSYRMLGNQRRYLLQDVLKLTNSEEKINTQNILYSRVSSKEQEKDLHRQSEVLKLYAKDKKLENITLIEDIGSGINFKKKGLKELIILLLSGKIDNLIVTHSDRLLRFGFPLIEQISKICGTTITVIDDSVENFETQLAKDVLEIITVFSSKLYGKRSHINKNKLEQ